MRCFGVTREVLAQHHRGFLKMKIYFFIGGTADPPFHSAGSISKMSIRTGELDLLETALLMLPSS